MRFVDVDARLEPIELVCECGVALDVHPPLPAPGPLNRWRAEGRGFQAEHDINGYARTPWRSAQAAGFRNRQARP